MNRTETKGGIPCLSELDEDRKRSAARYERARKVDKGNARE